MFGRALATATFAILFGAIMLATRAGAVTSRCQADCTLQLPSLTGGGRSSVAGRVVIVGGLCRIRRWRLRLQRLCVEQLWLWWRTAATTDRDGATLGVVGPTGFIGPAGIGDPVGALTSPVAPHRLSRVHVWVRERPLRADGVVHAPERCRQDRR